MQKWDGTRGDLHHAVQHWSPDAETLGSVTPQGIERSSFDEDQWVGALFEILLAWCKVMTSRFAAVLYGFCSTR